MRKSCRQKGDAWKDDLNYACGRLPSSRPPSGRSVCHHPPPAALLPHDDRRTHLFELLERAAGDVITVRSNVGCPPRRDFVFVAHRRRRVQKPDAEERRRQAPTRQTAYRKVHAHAFLVEEVVDALVAFAVRDSTFFKNRGEQYRHVSRVRVRKPVHVTRDELAQPVERPRDELRLPSFVGGTFAKKRPWHERVSFRSKRGANAVEEALDCFLQIHVDRYGPHVLQRNFQRDSRADFTRESLDASRLSLCDRGRVGRDVEFVRLLH